MKKLAILFFLLLPALSFSQTFRFRAEYIAIKLPYELDWTTWKKSSVLVTLDFDTDNGKIEIYSKEHQSYYSVSNLRLEVDVESKTIEFYAVDNKGYNCNIELVYNNTGEVELYIRKGEVEIFYQMKSI